MGKFYFTFLLLLVFNTLLCAQNDFFPLKINNKWDYNYKSVEKIYWDISYLAQINIDSGTVNYLVLDSTITDSMVIWNIQETDKITRKLYYYYNNTDTTYDFYSNVSFHLLEYLDTNHTIKSESYYEVFTFPLKWEEGVISPNNISRYSDDSSTVILKYHLLLLGTFSDSLVFEKDIGLVYAHSAEATGFNTPYFYNWEATLTSFLTGVNKIKAESAQKFVLFQNYPNPFNPTTDIGFRITEFGFVNLKVYDILGREVATLVNEEKKPGTYEVEFTGSNLSSGIYFYRLKAGAFIQTKKMILLK